MVAWLRKHFPEPNWTIDDTSGFHRDIDGDQIPDYLVYNNVAQKPRFIDAKKRKVHEKEGKYFFGFDEKFHASYTNISKKYNANVYVGFNDPSFDPDHIYILNLKQPPSFKLFYDNEHGKSFAYRWEISTLKKLRL